MDNNSSPSESSADTKQIIKEVKERGNWDNKVEYLLSSIGYAVGLGNVWRFPYLAYENGGGAFLFPYMIVLFLCGLPIFLLETSLGQFSSQGPVRAFNGMPLFKGIGYAMVMISIFIACYYNVILSWTIYYFYNSFTMSDLPWKNCNPDWNDPACYDREKIAECTKLDRAGRLGNFDVDCPSFDSRQTVVEKFWEIEAIGLLSKPTYNDTLTDPTDSNSTKLASAEFGDLGALGSVQPHLALTLFISWVLVGFSIIKGVKSSGKTMYFTATFPYVVLTILLIKGLTLEGSMEGIKYFINPNWDMMKSPKVWKEAATQIFYSLSVSWGGLLTLSSYNPFRNNLYRDTYLVVITNSATSIYAGFAIFSYLGFMATKLNLDVKDIVSSGPGLAFQVWPEAMTHLSESKYVCAIFSIVFFGMLYSLGISTMIVTVETICTSFMDTFPRMRSKRTYVVSALILILFIFGLPFVTGNGIYWFKIMDTYCASFTLVISAIIEMLAISYVYGLRRMCNDIKMMTGQYTNKFFQYAWSTFTPAILIVMLIGAAWTHEGVSVKCYGTDFYLNSLGPKIMGILLVFAPIFVMIGFAVREYSLKGSIAAACKPTRHWGPLKDEDRTQYNKERLDNFIYDTHRDIEEGKSLKAGLKA